MVQPQLLRSLRRTLALLALCVTLCAATSCAMGYRTIYVPDGTPVRLRQSVKGVDCWVLSSQGAWVKGRVDIPEGWYCLPVEGQGVATEQPPAQ